MRTLVDLGIHLDVTSADGYIQAIRLSFGQRGISLSGMVSPELALWLDQYKQGQIPTIPLSLNLSSLPSFTQKVLRELQKIPFGQTCSYGEIAKAIGHPHAARAVGNACRVNPLPLVIPCHRVIQTNGKLGGFAYGQALKKSLLNFERQIIQMAHA